jgi:hypothetical protein
MKIKRLLSNKLLLSISFLLIICSLAFDLSYNHVLASGSAGGNPISASELTDEVINNSNCPETIKNHARKVASGGGAIGTGEGTFIVARRGNDNIVMSCPGANDIEKLGIRLVVVLQSLLGLVLIFAIIKNVVGMGVAAANSDEEKYQASLKGMITSIVYTVLAIAAYSIVIFVLMVMGVGTAKQNGQWNIICQHRLVFDITFEGEDIPGDDQGCF